MPAGTITIGTGTAFGLASAPIARLEAIMAGTINMANGTVSISKANGPIGCLHVILTMGYDYGLTP